MNKQELTELMKATAQDAVVYAAEEHQVLLDFSLDSLVKVDEILSELYLRQQEQRHADDLLFTLSNVFGAYTGEVFIHHVGGEWYHDQSTPDAPYICVHHNGKSSRLPLWFIIRLPKLQMLVYAIMWLKL